jgi:hypothetical protein
MTHLARSRAIAGTPAGGRARRAAATIFWLAGVALAIAMIAIRIDLGRRGVGDPLDLWLFSAIGAVMLVYGVLGWSLVTRRSGLLVGWIFLATPIAAGIVFGGFSAIEWADATGQLPEPVFVWIAFIAPVSLVPTMHLAFPALALVFPDGRLPGPRWRRPVRLVYGAAIASVILAVLQAGQLDEGLPPSPLGVPLFGRVPIFLSTALGTPSVLIASALAIAALGVRVRRGRPDERRQVAWFLGAVLLVALAEGSTFASDDEASWADIVGAASLALLPAATTLAVLRYHLYDIDRIVSRTLGYGIVTAVLVAIFALAVLALQTTLAGVTGGDTVPVALSTLLVFSLFRPFYGRIQRRIDRRFDRAKVDAQEAIEGFGARLRDEVDLTTVRNGTLATADAVVHPATAGLWLRPR